MNRRSIVQLASMSFSFTNPSFDMVVEGVDPGNKMPGSNVRALVMICWGVVDTGVSYGKGWGWEVDTQMTGKERARGLIASYGDAAYHKAVEFLLIARDCQDAEGIEMFAEAAIALRNLGYHRKPAPAKARGGSG